MREAVLIGGVKKREMYSLFRFLRYIPDIRTARLWYFKLRKDKRDNAVLLALALVGMLWALARQRQLRRRIARQAEELDESRGILAEAQSFARLGYWKHVFGEPPGATWSEESPLWSEESPPVSSPQSIQSFTQSQSPPSSPYASLL